MASHYKQHKIQILFMLKALHTGHWTTVRWLFHSCLISSALAAPDNTILPCGPPQGSALAGPATWNLSHILPPSLPSICVRYSPCYSLLEGRTLPSASLLSPPHTQHIPQQHHVQKTAYRYSHRSKQNLWWKAIKHNIDVIEGKRKKFLCVCVCVCTLVCVCIH